MKIEIEIGRHSLSGNYGLWLNRGGVFWDCRRHLMGCLGILVTKHVISVHCGRVCVVVRVPVRWKWQSGWSGLWKWPRGSWIGGDPLGPKAVEQRRLEQERRSREREAAIIEDLHRHLTVSAIARTHGVSPNVVMQIIQHQITKPLTQPKP